MVTYGLPWNGPGDVSGTPVTTYPVIVAHPWLAAHSRIGDPVLWNWQTTVLTHDQTLAGLSAPSGRTPQTPGRIGISTT